MSEAQMTIFSPATPAQPTSVVNAAIARQIDVSELSTDDLVAALQTLNSAYRAGNPLVDDDVYDHVFLGELVKRDPEHPFLQSVEPETLPVDPSRVITHPEPMLSTQKLYSLDEVTKFAEDMIAAGRELGLSPDDILVRVTAKLDGISGRDDGRVLAKRGNGERGEDVSHAFERGLVPVGGRGLGVGEIVVVEEYFQTVLKPNFDMKHPRNFIAGFIEADTLKQHHLDAIDAGACRFVPYAMLPARELPVRAFLATYEAIIEAVSAVDYRIDGVIVEAVDARLKQQMGATSHHHRWMAAIKGKGDTAVTPVRDVTLQVGRTGRITPVAELVPVELDGATITRVTAHTARHLERLGIGPGAELEIIRSGAVIPKIERVIKASANPVDLTKCPECGHATTWDNDYLVCPNLTGCKAQVARAIEHFFSILGNCDGFGPSACETLVNAGVTRLEDIYAMNAASFVNAGFGPGQAANLERELVRSRTDEVNDAHFLAAFGIRHLGRGDSRKLLAEVPLEEIGSLSAERITAIHGFGSMTAGSIATEIGNRWPTISALLQLDFNLKRTARATEVSGSPIAGRKIVFTGTMTGGDRSEMEDRARSLGAQVQSSVNSKTDMLVIGEKAGASKLKKAEQHQVKVLSEREYLNMMET